MTQRPPRPCDSTAYTTRYGCQLLGDSRTLLTGLDDSSIDLVVTSPPFALLRKKSYGNEDQGEYVDWLCTFGEEVLRVLKTTGSFVLDLGGAYQRGRPVRSLYNFRVLIRFCDELGFRLAEEFFWFNPSKLPSPIEWVNKRKIRAKDAVNTIWWLSKEDFPKADVSKVRVPYSDSMQRLLKDPQGHYTPKARPSGHDISARFADSNGGALPPNLLAIPNSGSNSPYLRACKKFGLKGHPARFPEALPEFFIEFLTDPGDVVLDIFSGSNTTGEVAQAMGRNWITMERDADFVAASVLRFMHNWPEQTVEDVLHTLAAGEAVDLEAVAPPALIEKLELPL